MGIPSLGKGISPLSLPSAPFSSILSTLLPSEIFYLGIFSLINFSQHTKFSWSDCCYCLEQYSLYFSFLTHSKEKKGKNPKQANSQITKQKQKCPPPPPPQKKNQQQTNNNNKPATHQIYIPLSLSNNIFVHVYILLLFSPQSGEGVWYTLEAWYIMRPVCTWFWG